jgi:methylated-DNA-[protein]-cysteine S-methyltransferase
VIFDWLDALPPRAAAGRRPRRTVGVTGQDGGVFAIRVVHVPGPMGALTLGATEVGLALVAFGDEPETALWAAEKLGEEPTADPDGTVEAATQLAEYLAGDRKVFDLPLDWRLTSGRQRTVLEVLYETVPYGATVSYGELAARSGLGRDYTGARGVGSIMGSNPLPVVVPCHRVLAADGLGGFGGGLARKEWLLGLEGVLTGGLF